MQIVGNACNDIILYVQISRVRRGGCARKTYFEVQRSFLLWVNLKLMTSRQESITEGWDKMEDATMVITDIGIISKREKAQPEYTVVSSSVWCSFH